MICYEVWVNGEKVALAGQENALLLSADVLYHRKQNDQFLNVSAIVWKDGTVGSTDSAWETPFLKIGDEVRIKLVESDSPDPPTWQDVTGVRMPPPWNDIVGRCSFCGADRKDRKRMFEGPNVTICDGCVEYRYRIVTREVPNAGT